MRVGIPRRARDLVELGRQGIECAILELRSEAPLELGLPARGLGIPLRGSRALSDFKGIAGGCGKHRWRLSHVQIPQIVPAGLPESTRELCPDCRWRGRGR